MTVIRLEKNFNGSHDYFTAQTDFPPPEGHAVIPDEMGELENFPFGEVTAEEIDGLPTVTGWTPLPIQPAGPEGPEYNEFQQLGQQITEEELARIELGQQVTDLELMMLGGNENV